MQQATSAIERTLPPGTRLGRYEVITHLASGGMASVFLARSLGAAGFTRLVAIKLLHPHVAADEQFTAMFLDEARLAARIRHPNVVPTVDLQDGTDGHYLVMEFIEGDSLLGLLRQGHKVGKPIPPSIAVRVILDALAGLNAAHDLTGDLGEPLNLVHRDVSPHNILVGVDGIARIVDFGIARAEERLGTTRDGQVKGKLAYMAPEQTTSEPVDRRVDVFTAGIVLWECLAQRRLFRGQTDAEVLRKLLEKPIPHLREINEVYPEALDAVVARALERSRDARFASAADFADELEAAARPMGIATSRQVAAYVREVSGETIDALMRRVRAFVEGTKIPSTPPPPRADNPNSAVRASTPMTHAASFVPVDIDPGDVQFRSRKPFLLAVIPIVLIAAGVAFAVVMSNRAQPAPPRAVVAAPPPLTVTEPVPPLPSTLAPTASAPIAAVTELPRSANEHVATGFAHKATTTTSATTAVSAAPVTPPAPTGSAFNPESM